MEATTLKINTSISKIKDQHLFIIENRAFIFVETDDRKIYFTSSNRWLEEKDIDEAHKYMTLKEGWLPLIKEQFARLRGGLL